MSFKSDYSEYNVRLCNRMLRRWGRARCRAMGMPTDPENAPGEFGRWLSAARDRAAVRRGCYPDKGRGWVLVRAV